MKHETIQHVPVQEIRKHVGNLIEQEKQSGGRGAKVRVSMALGTSYANFLSFIAGKLGPSRRALDALGLEARTVFALKNQGE